MCLSLFNCTQESATHVSLQGGNLTSVETF